MKEGDKVEIFVNYGRAYTNFIGQLVSYGDSEVVIKTKDGVRTALAYDSPQTIVFNRRYVISITVLEE